MSEDKVWPDLSKHRRVDDSLREIAKMVLTSMEGHIERHSLRALTNMANGEGHEDSLSISLAKDPTSWISEVQMLVQFSYETSKDAREEGTLDLYRVWLAGVSVQINIQDSNRRSVPESKELAAMFQRTIELGEKIEEIFSGSHVELLISHEEEKKTTAARKEADRKTKIFQNAIFILKAQESLGTLKVGKARTADFSGMDETIDIPLGTYEPVVLGKKKFTCVALEGRKMLYSRTQ